MLSKFFNRKKIAKVVLGTVMSFTIMASSALAATRGGWEEISWSKYNLKFSLPTAVKEVENTDTKYIAESDSLRFEIYPWKDSSVDEETVANDAYADLGIKRPTITSKKKRDLNNFKGYEILGEGFIDGKGVNFSVLGFIDPNSSNNFAAYIIYWQDRAENNNIEVERDIIESIEPIK